MPCESAQSRRRAVCLAAAVDVLHALGERSGTLAKVFFGYAFWEIDRDLLGADVQAKFADLKRASADRCPRLLGSVIHGFTELELAGSFDHSDPAPEVSWERTLDALDRTLQSWADATAQP